MVEMSYLCWFTYRLINHRQPKRVSCKVQTIICATICASKAKKMVSDPTNTGYAIRTSQLELFFRHHCGSSDRRHGFYWLSPMSSVHSWLHEMRSILAEDPWTFTTNNRIKICATCLINGDQGHKTNMLLD
jgi:hypothetical protein